MPKVTIVTKDRILKMTSNKEPKPRVLHPQMKVGRYVPDVVIKAAGIFPQDEQTVKFKQSWAKSPLVIESFWRNFKIVCVAGFLGFLVLLGWFAKDTYDYLKDIQHKAALCQEMKCDDVAAMAEKLELPMVVK